MTSGIYTLEFSDASVYVGKAIDIEARWKQHKDKLEQGKAAHKLQKAYDKCGPPKYSIAHRVHADHIDIVESIIIENNRGNPLLLNTASGHRVSPNDVSVYAEYYSLLEHSTAEHIRSLVQLEETVQKLTTSNKRLEVELEMSNNEFYELQAKGIRLPSEWKDLWFERESELERLRELEEYAITYSKMSWFDRLFNQFKL